MEPRKFRQPRQKSKPRQKSESQDKIPSAAKTITREPRQIRVQPRQNSWDPKIQDKNPRAKIKIRTSGEEDQDVQRPVPLAQNGIAANNSQGADTSCPRTPQSWTGPLGPQRSGGNLSQGLPEHDARRLSAFLRVASRHSHYYFNNLSQVTE